MLNCFAVISWDPPREVFPWHIPIIDRPIMWYGLFFALGCFVAYQVFIKLSSMLLSRFALVEENDVFSIEQIIKKAAQYDSIPLITNKLKNSKAEIAAELNYFLTQQNTPFAEQRKELEQLLDPSLLTLKQKIAQFTEKFTLYALLGMILGARFGDLFFYQNLSVYRFQWLDALKVWQGGLASHGAAIGILTALFLFSRKIKKLFSQISFFMLVDLIVIPACFAGFFIRLGNFFNQEVLGTVSSMPWAIHFLHPLDGSAPLIRHPVQLYEAIFYLGCGLFFYRFWHTKSWWQSKGKTSGVFFMAIFAFRFLIEFFKEEQSVWFDNFPLTMGQLLSIPFVIGGIWLIKKQKQITSSFDTI